MAVSSGYRDYVLGQLAALATLRARPMFGGIGLYCDELFFALIADDTLYLLVDDRNRGDFSARGMAAFRPYVDRPQLSVSYYAVPAEVLEDVAELTLWAQRSLAVARTRPPATKPRRTRR